MGLARRITWRHVSLWAALALVAQSEWQLALLVGWPVWIAWAAPLALDAYVLGAVRAGRDLGASVLVSAGSVFASHALHAWQAAGGHVAWWLTGAASSVPLLVTWRVHHLPTHTQEKPCPTPRSAEPHTRLTARSSATAPPTRSQPNQTSPAPPANTAPSEPTAPGASTTASGATPPPPAAAASPAPSTSARRAAARDSAPSRADAVQLLAALNPIPGPTQIARTHGISARTAIRWRQDATALQQQRRDAAALAALDADLEGATP